MNLRILLRPVCWFKGHRWIFPWFWGVDVCPRCRRCHVIGPMYGWEEWPK